jgi:hypothetical protein
MISEFKIRANQHALSTSILMTNWVKQNLFSDFTLVSKFDWDSTRRASRGGIYKDGPGINIAMYWAVPSVEGETYRFREYPSFDADKVIGGFYSKRPYDKLEAIIAHEVAHAIQFFAYKKLNTRCKPHGAMFKQYYGMLRTDFLNAKLPNQKALASDYEEYVQKLQANNINTLRLILKAANTA